MWVFAREDQIHGFPRYPVFKKGIRVPTSYAAIAKSFPSDSVGMKAANRKL